MTFGIDLEGAIRLVEFLLDRAAGQTRLWIGGWLAAVLTVTVIAVVCHASLGAYLILVVVAGLVVNADSGGEGADRPDGHHARGSDGQNVGDSGTL